MNMKPSLQFEIRRTKTKGMPAGDPRISPPARAIGHLLRRLRKTPFGLWTSDFPPISRIRPAQAKAGAVIALATVLAGGALAQSNGVPGPEDYARFSTFITDRNIFDPNRVPHSFTGRAVVRHSTRATPAPGIRFVGTMDYAKGTFAFFSGNSSEWSKVVQVGDQFASYTVTALCATNVVLEATNQTLINVPLGGGLKQANGQWVSAEAADITTTAGTTDTTTSAASGGSSGSEAATPSSATEPNDILKRLMQQREKENQ